MIKSTWVKLSGALLMALMATACATAPSGEAARPASEVTAPADAAPAADAPPAAEPAAPESATPAPATIAPPMEEARPAIEEARAAVRRAESEGALWRDSEQMLADAEAALQAGDTARAIELANQARRQAENAIAQKQSEQARLAGGAGATSYNVVGGDSLWSISGKAEIYGNPYHWPLIYKANRDKIRDADLIYPGEVFGIRRDVNSTDMVEAARHARSRGAWSLGKVEASDQTYIAR